MRLLGCISFKKYKKKCFLDQYTTSHNLSLEKMENKQIIATTTEKMDAILSLLSNACQGEKFLDKIFTKVIGSDIPMCDIKKKQLNDLNEFFIIVENKINKTWLDYSQNVCIDSHKKTSINLEKKKNHLLEIIHCVRVMSIMETRLKEHINEFGIESSHVFSNNLVYEFNMLSMLSYKKLDDLSNAMQLHMYVLQEIIRNKWYRFGGDRNIVYEPVGNTQFFRPVTSKRDPTEYMTWLEICYELCSSSKNVKHWQTFSSSQSQRNNLKEVLMNDTSIPEVHLTRNMYSFRDGIYYTADDKFVPYTLANTEHDEHASSSSNNKSLIFHSSLLLFDHLNFADAYREDVNVMDLPTPLFDSILDNQNYDESMKFWLYVFFGRMLYPLHDKDNWHHICFLKGVGGTGKSTLLQLLQCFFPSDSIGIISGHNETTFGFQDFDKKMLIVCPEYRKSDVNISESRLLSMFCGESVALPKKHGTQKIVANWNVPGIFGGNEAFSFADMQGQFARRVIYFDFNKSVTEKNSLLLKDIKNKELHFLLRKFNWCYLQAVKLHGHVDLYTPGILPERLHANKEEVLCSNNLLIRFLTTTDYCELGAQKITPKSTFIRCFKEFLRQETRVRNINFDTDYYQYSFDKLHISKIENDVTHTCFLGVHVNINCPLFTHLF
jgi:hypothetical protein